MSEHPPSGHPARSALPARAGAAPRVQAPALDLLMLGLLMLGLLLTACSGGGFVDGNLSATEDDFEARHARLLHAVLNRPGELRTQLASRDRRIRERNLGHWQAVIARQDAFFAQREESKQRDETQFLRMIELQRKFSEKREEDHSERWAQFIERSAPAGAAAGDSAP